MGVSVTIAGIVESSRLGVRLLTVSGDSTGMESSEIEVVRWKDITGSELSVVLVVLLIPFVLFLSFS